MPLIHIISLHQPSSDGSVVQCSVEILLYRTCENPGIDRIAYPNGQAMDKETTHANNQPGSIKFVLVTTGTSEPLDGLGKYWTCPAASRTQTKHWIAKGTGNTS